MTIRELIEELLKHDMSLNVYLINGNDLMWPSQFVEAEVKHTYTATPPKLDEITLLDAADKNYLYANSLLIHWT